MAKPIFRQKSLERLASPERLDQLVQITSPIGWASLLSIGALLIATIFWSIYGSIPTTVAGGGILIKSGGVADIVAVAQGQVTSIYVEEGSEVRQGQVVARIAHPQTLEQIRNAQSTLKELRQTQEEIEAYGTESIKLQLEALAKERSNLNKGIEGNRERLVWLDEKIKLQEELLKDGLITKQTLLNTRDEKARTEDDIESARNQLKNLKVRELDQINQKEQAEITHRTKLSEAERRLNSLEEELELKSRVVSSYSGRVVEVLSFEGNIVSPGTPMINLELTGSAIQNLQAVIYMPPDQGKQVQPNMLMRLMPSTVNIEEYGYMLAIVTHVSEYPSTPKGMVRVLKNDALVQQFSQTGAPIAVYADLIPSSHTASGYKWSSPNGPPTEIYSGTLAFASVETKTQPPISLVIPYLKKKMGL